MRKKKVINNVAIALIAALLIAFILSLIFVALVSIKIININALPSWLQWFLGGIA